MPTQNLGHKKQKKGRESDDESTGCTSMDQQCVNTSKDVSTQTEETAEEQTSHALEKKLTDCYSFIADLRNRVSITAPFCEESLQKNEDVKFYTVVFDHAAVSQHSTRCQNQKLTCFQEFMPVMLKLRLNCQNQDLANQLILWPDHEILQKTMPECFWVAFGTKVAVILDCFEIFCERPSNLEAQACTRSNYKHHKYHEDFVGHHATGVCFICFRNMGWSFN